MAVGISQVKVVLFCLIQLLLEEWKNIQRFLRKNHSHFS